MRISSLLAVVALVWTVGSWPIQAKAGEPDCDVAADHEIVIAVDGAAIPEGQTGDQPALVRVNGKFPNTCFRWKEGAVSHLGDYLHEVRGIATFFDEICAMVLVPYDEAISLGRLERGVHVVRFIAGDGSHFEHELVIE